MADDDPQMADRQGEERGAAPANGDIAVQLPAIQAWLRSKGLHYPDALISHYLAALLTKPFVVLSGLSGSGKTRLALDVGELFGGTVHVVPVKPDWTDTRGIMGYYNPLTQRYEVTTALRAALDAHATTDPVTLVLDEMNLAHVERYFADVLSAMEGGHPIPLHDSDEVVAQQAVPKQLVWPKNLLVVGTVNVDETTYPFSPKVLDRAFVIDINTIDAIGYIDGELHRTPAAKPVLPSFQPSRDWRSLPVTSTDRAFVLDLHRVLTEAGRPFGYRTIAEGLAYLAHARPFRNAGLNAQDTLIASKILPRFHGRRHELEPALHGLAQWLDLDLEGEIDPSQPIGHPLTHAALVAMSRQLVSEGYVASTVG
jgi:5-methylcytosine-specific restriction enzyme B